MKTECTSNCQSRTRSAIMMSLMPKTRNRSRISLLLSITGTAFLLLALTASAQQTAKRLILKDGSYQLVTKYEVKGDRVRYLSAERNEWEEVPNSLVDWAATNKFEKDRATRGSRTRSCGT